MAAALRPLLRRHAALPPSPMLRSLFPAPYSKAAAAATTAARPPGPAVCHAPLPPPLLREVTPRRAPPKGEPRCCNTVPSTMSDSTKSLLDKLKDLKDIKKSLQDMEKNIEERREMINKALHDSRIANAMFRKRVDDLRKLLAKIRNGRDDSGRIRAMFWRLEDDYEKDWAIQESKDRLIDEQLEMLSKEIDDYTNALRRYRELATSTMKQVEKVKKVAKVCAAAGLVGGLLLILAKI